MTTETNPNLKQPIQWIQWITLVAVIAAPLLTLLGVWLSFTSGLDHRFELQRQITDSGLQEIRSLIQASESNRQADTRAVNARVDAAEQLVVATSPYRCPSIN